MRTGLSKKQKTTSVFFDEASPIIEVWCGIKKVDSLFSRIS